MAIRLRRAPPRWRRRPRTVPVLGVAMIAFAATAWLSVRADPHRMSEVRIERVPVVAAHKPGMREVDGTLISLPPVAPPRPFLADHRIVAFYGNPLAEVLGVLGAADPPQTIARLRAQADEYARISTDKKVVPAVHLIYAVAQRYTDDDGAYLFRMPDAMVDEWVRLTRENGMLLFLDIQMGRSTVEAELPRINKFLQYDHVHVGLDPEFAWGPDEHPGIDIGHMDADQINRAQQMLQRFAIEHKLPTKMLMMHQFRVFMITNKDKIKAYDRVELIIDADGVGTRQEKIDTWNVIIKQDNVDLAAIKLFYKHDQDIFAPEDVLNFEPKPAIIIYQ
jgi:hypothetical protein